jgi:hypothetical protein
MHSTFLMEVHVNTARSSVWNCLEVNNKTRRCESSRFHPTLLRRNRHTHCNTVRWCIQKFPGARTANGTALCHWVQLYRYFVSRSSEFCRHNPLCCFSYLLTRPLRSHWNIGPQLYNCWGFYSGYIFYRNRDASPVLQPPTWGLPILVAFYDMHWLQWGYSFQVDINIFWKISVLIPLIYFDGFYKSARPGNVD